MIEIWYVLVSLLGCTLMFLGFLILMLLPFTLVYSSVKLLTILKRRKNGTI